jgi:predicted site-specific integrase-resolvase
MNTAVIYARVSSVGDRQSTDRQVEDLKRHIFLNDMDLVKVYEEKMGKYGDMGSLGGMF